jgi:hypothetical protein
MERTTVQHHDQGISDFAIDLVQLEFNSIAGSAGGSLSNAV